MRGIRITETRICPDPESSPELIYQRIYDENEDGTIRRMVDVHILSDDDIAFSEAVFSFMTEYGRTTPPTVPH